MKKKYNPTLLGTINRNYVYLANRYTQALTDKFGFYCDLYFPKHEKNPVQNGEYPTVNMFEPHTMPIYNETPDVKNVKFYIPYLLKKENMNSSDLEFDSAYLTETEQRPFIECSKKDELPIQTKVIVHIDDSEMRFFVDLKTVVNGAGGHMLLRQYLAPVFESEEDR